MNINKKFIISASIVVVVLAVSISYYAVGEFLSDVAKFRAERAGVTIPLKHTQQTADVAAGDGDGTGEDTESPSEYGIYIIGEIASPGFYLLPEGSRINDAIEAAGGATGDADLTKINIAQYVNDQDKIVIPPRSDSGAYERQESAEIQKAAEQPPAMENASKQAIVDGVVNINIANLEELCTLPGIGSITAQNIIDFREKNGNFKSVLDIKQVRRIGDKTYDNIKAFISVD